MAINAVSAARLPTPVLTKKPLKVRPEQLLENFNRDWARQHPKIQQRPKRIIDREPRSKAPELSARIYQQLLLATHDQRGAKRQKVAQEQKYVEPPINPQEQERCVQSQKEFAAFKERWHIPDDLSTLERLGKGGYGIVYSIPNVRVGAPFVALKHVLPQQQNVYNSMMAEYEYRQEVCSLMYIARLGHAAFPKYIDDAIQWPSSELQCGYQFMVVMERASGSTLLSYLKKPTAFPDYQILLLVLRQLFSAEGFLNLKGYTHLDMKPENVMFDPETNKVVIIDLGAIRLLDQTLVHKMATVCSPCYTPPEVYDFIDAGSMQQATLFSHGALLFELMTRELLIPKAAFDPHGNIRSFYLSRLVEGSNLRSARFWQDQVEPLLQERWHLNVDQTAISTQFIEKMIDFDPKKRFDDVMHALQDPLFTNLNP